MPEQYLHGVEVVQGDEGTRPIATANASTTGYVGTAPDAPGGVARNMPIWIANPRDAREKIGATGTLADAYEAQLAQGVQTGVMVIAPEGADAGATAANVAGTAADQTGAHALGRSRSVLDVTPRILAAPGFSGGAQATAVNPVVSGLITVANQSRAIVVKDGPNTNETDALADVGFYGSDRLYMVDPAVTVQDASGSTVARPASAYVAGLIARKDVEKGFWWSPSNTIIRGITGTTRPITFYLSQTDTEANRLNDGKVATIVRESGMRLWGSRSASADQLWAFLSVRRTADVLFESIDKGLLWALARPASVQVVRDLQDSLQALGNHLISQGALLGFKAWFDAERTNEAAMKAGHLYCGFDFEPPAPLEHLTIRGQREGAYYDDLITAVKAA